MTVKFDHAVIYGGKFYPANTPIEVVEKKPVDQAETPDTVEVEQVEAETPDTVEVVEKKPVDQAAPKTEKAVKNGRKSTGRKPKSKPAD